MFRVEFSFVLALSILLLSYYVQFVICNFCILLNSVFVLYPFSQHISPTTPNKPLVPLDWASGFTTKPDPSVVNKHIRKVVDVSRWIIFYECRKLLLSEFYRDLCVLIGFLVIVKSVFRNYDHDHDGYISQEDFESIAANFPFLDSFCVLDKDQ